MFHPSRSRRPTASVETGAFTLMELLTVMVVIALLVVMLVPVLRTIQAKAEKARCMTNLRNLSVAANLYVQQNGSWPQIDTALLSGNRTQYAAQWIAALEPFGVSQENWICPTAQRMLKDPDLKNPKNIRVDYNAMPFDDKPRTPFRWSRHPWFIEHNSLHGNGNLIIFTDGSIVEASDIISRSGS